MIKNLDWKKVLGVAVAIGLLFLSFYKVNLRELWTSIAQLNFLYLFASFCSAVAMNWAKGMRWRALVREVKPLSKTRMFALFHVGQMINLSLPALTGQAGRIVMLSKAEGLSKTLCFTTVAMEVLFDGISLIVLVYLASFIFAFPVWLRQAEIYAAIGISVILITALLIWRNKRSLEYFGKTRIKRRFPRFYANLQKWTESMISGMTSLKSGRGILEVSFYSILVWLFHVLVAVALIMAFKLDIPAWAGVVVVIINSFLLMIPISPGNIGSFQIIVISVLHELFKVPRAEAAAFSLVLHFMDIVPVFIIGIYFLFTNHITFKTLRKEAEIEAQKADAPESVQP